MLSGLVHLPELYSSFVEEQYKFVFAIAIQYTNPFKYVTYVILTLNFAVQCFLCVSLLRKTCFNDIHY